MRKEELYDNRGPILQKWRLDSIPSGRTSLTTVPSTRVVGPSETP
jgi:hypothetical protein